MSANLVIKLNRWNQDLRAKLEAAEARVVELEESAEKARIESSGQFWAADEVTELRARVVEFERANAAQDTLIILLRESTKRHEDRVAKLQLAARKLGMMAGLNTIAINQVAFNQLMELVGGTAPKA